MSAELVLRDAGIEAGLGLSPARDLALWAACSPGELGALGREALASSASPLPRQRCVYLESVVWARSRGQRGSGSWCSSKSAGWNRAGTRTAARASNGPTDRSNVRASTSSWSCSCCESGPAGENWWAGPGSWSWPSGAAIRRSSIADG